jgi:hypothetical protein
LTNQVTQKRDKMIMIESSYSYSQCFMEDLFIATIQSSSGNKFLFYWHILSKTNTFKRPHTRR